MSYSDIPIVFIFLGSGTRELIIIVTQSLILGLILLCIGCLVRLFVCWLVGSSFFSFGDNTYDVQVQIMSSNNTKLDVDRKASQVRLNQGKEEEKNSMTKKNIGVT